MRKLYHLCLSSHDEVLFRNEEDFNMGFNCLALAILRSESRLLAEGFISTHHHEALQTDNPVQLMKMERYSYTRYFNAKYHRRGRLGERHCFIIQVEGLYHSQTLLNYVLRQGLHHGLVSTPFAYPHCSANTIFRQELGKLNTPELIANGQRYKYLPDGISLPSRYRMSASGLLLREDILDTDYTEDIYISPRNFLFQMNKIEKDKDEMEQIKENGMPPVTLEVVENGVKDFDMRQALINEQGRVNNNALTDVELCKIIDDIILPTRYFASGHESSIYLLSDRQRADIGNYIWKETRRYTSPAGLFKGKITTEAQIRRCLAIK